MVEPDRMDLSKSRCCFRCLHRLKLAVVVAVAVNSSSYCYCLIQGVDETSSLRDRFGYCNVVAVVGTDHLSTKQRHCLNLVSWVTSTGVFTIGKKYSETSKTFEMWFAGKKISLS